MRKGSGSGRRLSDARHLDALACSSPGSAEVIQLRADRGLRLAPCPFCGNATIDAEQPRSDEPDWAVTCLDCGTLGPAAWRAAEAVERWNRRAKLAGNPSAGPRR